MDKWGTAAIMFGVIVLLLGCTTWLGEWWTERERLRRLVFHSLEGCHADGDFEPFGYYGGKTHREVAYELALFVDVDDKPTRLEPHVRAWMRQKGLS
jgi:hypothetical protein